MNENRRQILEMLANGAITADEAERLIVALEKEQPAAAGAGTAPGSKPRPKYLRVVVEDESGSSPIASGIMGGSDHRGPTKVNVRVPMQLLRAGVKLASLIPPQAQIKVNDALQQQGLTLDLSQLKPENLEELVDQLSELTVDVDDSKSKVRVFCE
jgi:SHOCT-like protein